MIDTSASLVGVAGAALLLLGFAPAPHEADLTPVAPIAAPAPTSEPPAYLRWTLEDAARLFDSEPLSVARPAPATAPQPVASPKDRASEENSPPPRTKTIGCEGAVSPLVRVKGAAAPARCLT